MNAEPDTRPMSAEELSTVLARLDDRLKEPRTQLGLGSFREFKVPTVAERPVQRRRAPAAAAALSRSADVDARFVARRRARRARLPRLWWLWLAAFIALGLALGTTLAYAVEATHASPPPALPRAMVAPAPAPVVERDEAPVQETREVGVGIEARRRAVELLLAGRTRAALEHYRRLLDEAPAALADAQAIEQVARLLAQELRECEQEASTPCGL